MAFKITAKEQKRIDEVFARFQSQAETLSEAVTTFNEIVNEARGKVDDEVAVLNDLRDELRGIVEDIHADMESQYDDKSESWQESERGDATKTWIDSLEEIRSEFEEEIAVDPPEDLQFTPDELAIVLRLSEGITSEPEY